MNEESYRQQEGDLLRALEIISEQLAKWQRPGAPLNYDKLSNDEVREIEFLDLVLENAIVPAGGEW